jgi:hypothetical protein
MQAKETIESIRNFSPGSPAHAKLAEFFGASAATAQVGKKIRW